MTHDQHIASDPRINVFVSASAGTGKTKVLTDRVLRLLLAGAEPGKILCITYTKAAAAEMKQRIEKQLADWAIAEEDALTTTLTQLTGEKPGAKALLRARRLFTLVLDAPQRLRIETIHAFCQSVLARFPLEAGVAPHFTLIEERGARELLREARLRLFTQTGRDNARLTASITALATMLNDIAFGELMETIVKERRRIAPALEKGLPEAKKRLYAALGFEESLTFEALHRRYFTYSHEEEAALRQACTVLASGTTKMDKTMRDGLTRWREAKTDTQSYSELFLTIKGEPRKSLSSTGAQMQWERISDVLCAEQQRVMAHMEAENTLKNAEATMHLLTLAEALLALYRELKTLHGYMDFDDIIAHAVDLLHRPGVAPWVLYKLDGGIDHLLLDEAQDTSPEQWRLIDALVQEFFAGEGARKTGRTVFVVGDEKQSIYSFQGADPLAFEAMQSRLRRRIETGGAPFRRVRLGLSFRSAEPVLKAVDAVFAAPDARDGLVFEESDIAHALHRAGAGGRVELWPLVEAPPKEKPLPWSIAESNQRQPRPEALCANEVARTIADWLSGKRLLASQGRPVRPGDIMILLQRRGAFAGDMLRALKQHGVPVAGADRLVLTEHIAVMDCMALADFLLLPQDDLALAIVLKSPLVGLSEDDLFALAYDRGEHSLWQRLRDNPSYAEAHEFLAAILARTDYLPPYELFSFVLETCGGRRKLAGRLGHEIHDPLNEFLALAMQYDTIHPPSLLGFLQWLRSDTTEIKRDMEKGRDEVRILTVHGAKGLQAPIVFLPDAVRVPRQKDRILWTDDEPPLPLWSPAAEGDDRLYEARKSQLSLAVDREYRRLLYVAMTRAEDELYVCGWKGDRPVAEKCWYELVRRAAVHAGWAEEEGKVILVSAQQSPIPAQAAQIMDAFPALPSWSGERAAEEPVKLRLLPSRVSGNAKGNVAPIAARERGILLHRLLQYLPDVLPARRNDVTMLFLARHAGALAQEEREHMARQVNAILAHPDFAHVFADGSMAEVAVSGTITDEEGRQVLVSAQLDRLAVNETHALIIDYKTGHDVPEDELSVPIAYVKQMRIYRRLVADIYPGKTVICALLWTAGPKLQPLSAALLEA